MFKKMSVLFLSAAMLLCLAPVVRADFSSPSKNISNSALDSKFPKIAYIEGSPNVFAIWAETNGTDDWLYFSKSTDAGSTWSTPVQLITWGQILRHSSDLQDYYAYSIAVSDPYVYVVLQWRANPSDDFEIYYGMSPDLGDNWSTWFFMTNNTTDSYYPAICAYGEYVHVAYQDSWPGDESIMYKRITNYGAGPVDQTRRLTFSSTDAYYPRIAVSNSGYCVSVVYEDLYSGVYNIFYKHIDGYGAGTYYTRQLTFGSDPLVDWNGCPDIATSVGSSNTEYVYIVYQAFWPGNREIMYKRLDGFGYGSFNVYTARLTYSTTSSESNAVSFDSIYNYVHISYHDAWPGNNDVMYRKLSNFGGAGFSSQRVSWGTGDSSSATVAASGAWAYVVWADDTSGNYEIYVKKGL